MVDSTELLQFLDPGIVHAGSHCQGLLGQLDITELLLMLLVTPVVFLI